MSKSINRSSFLPQGWLRVICFLLVYFGCMVLAAFMLENYLPAKKNSVDIRFFYLSILISSFISVVLVFCFRIWMDKKSIMSLGIKSDQYGHHFSVGLLIGSSLIFLGSAFLSFAGAIQWVQFQFQPNAFLSAFLLMIVVAFSEEIVFRGYILNNLLDAFSPVWALVISAVLFGLFHGSNPGAGTLPMVNVVLAGILLGINYMFTRNLWFGFGLHFIWNFLQGPVLGYKVSGIQTTSLLEMQLKGASYMNGGNFGFEGSLTGSVVLIIGIVCLYLIYQRQAKVSATLQ